MCALYLIHENANPGNWYRKGQIPHIQNSSFALQIEKKLFWKEHTLTTGDFLISEKIYVLKQLTTLQRSKKLIPLCAPPQAFKLFQ